MLTNLANFLPFWPKNVGRRPFFSFFFLHILDIQLFNYIHTVIQRHSPWSLSISSSLVSSVGKTSLSRAENEIRVCITASRCANWDLIVIFKNRLSSCAFMQYRDVYGSFLCFYLFSVWSPSQKNINKKAVNCFLKLLLRYIAASRVSQI